jgi:hypothetical protein
MHPPHSTPPRAPARFAAESSSTRALGEAGLSWGGGQGPRPDGKPQEAIAGVVTEDPGAAFEGRARHAAEAGLGLGPAARVAFGVAQDARLPRRAGGRAH